MLDLNNYRNQIDEIEVGQTVRFNHTTCQAGEDTRRRLYLTRPEARPDSVVGYCHNCQQGGRIGTSKYEAYRDELHGQAEAKTIVDVIERPKNLEVNINHWPSDAKAWAVKNRINQGIIAQFGLGFDTSTHRVYLPRYQKIQGTPQEVDLNGYQLRKVREDASPKYITCSKQDDPGYTLMGDRGGNVVLVEDLVSGIHCYLSTPYNVLVNYGTKVNLEALYAIKDMPELTVWLDNDSSHVKLQAKTMQRTWQLLSGRTAHCILGLGDPKHFTWDGIKGALDG